MKIFSLITLFLICSSLSIKGQQTPDTTFVPNIEHQSYESGKGPTICIDSVHNNLHTLDGGFAPFARLMKVAGFRMKDLDQPVLNSKVLAGCDVYAIINPLHESNLGNWRLPNPSAFTGEEVTEINKWVEAGGSLFLVADHMPFAGAAELLGNSFGFSFSNGFANLVKERNQPDYFSMDNGRLYDHTLLKENIQTVTSFTGSAFTSPDEAEIIMKFKKGDVSLEPEIAWQFTDTTKTISLEGYAQGAVLNYGSGKVAVFGEAAMFTAQKVTNQNGTFSVGFTSRIAPNNQLFAVYLMEYLAAEVK